MLSRKEIKNHKRRIKDDFARTVECNQRVMADLFIALGIDVEALSCETIEEVPVKAEAVKTNGHWLKRFLKRR